MSSPLTIQPRLAVAPTKRGGARDHSWVVPGPCAPGCSFCPHSRGGDWSPKGLERLGAFLDDNPRLERLSLIGSDLLRHPARDALLTLIAARDKPPAVYLYTPSPEGPELAAVARHEVVRGFVVPFLHPTTPMSRSAPRPAKVIAAAARASGRFELVPHFFIGGFNAAVLPALAEAIYERAPFERARISVALQLGRGGQRRLSALAPAFIGLDALSRETGARFVLDSSEYPPPCVAELYSRAPALYARVLRDGGPGASRNTALPQCARCSLATRCRWRFDAYIARHGADEFVPVPETGAQWRHISAFDPDHPEGILEHRWFVERAALSSPCSLPWSSMEMMGIAFVTSQPCNLDYLKFSPHRTPPIEGFDSWNGPFFRQMRAALAGGRIDDVCHKHCMRRHRARPSGEGEGGEGEIIEISGRSPRFLANRLRYYQELMAGASRLRARPQSLTISPTWACNYACSFCHTTPIRDGKTSHELGPEYYERLRDHLPYLAELNVSGAGEPLISRHFRDFLVQTDFSPYPDLRVTITTNGSPLTPRLVDRLYHVPLRGLIISLNAARAETHREISETSLYDRVRANIDYLVANRHRFLHGAPLIQLSFVVVRSNFRDLPAFVALGEREGLRVVLLAMEVDQHNERESLTWHGAPPGELDEALAIIDALRTSYRHNRFTSQYLETLRSSLLVQRRFQPKRIVEAELWEAETPFDEPPP